MRSYRVRARGKGILFIRNREKSVAVSVFRVYRLLWQKLFLMCVTIFALEILIRGQIPLFFMVCVTIFAFFVLQHADIFEIT